MTHFAKITLPLAHVQIHIGLVPVTLICSPVEVEVGYHFRKGEAASDEGPAEPDVFAAQSARLTRAIVLHDASDTMSLIFSPNADLLPYLGARQLDWIEEHLPVPEGT